MQNSYETNVDTTAARKILADAAVDTYGFITSDEDLATIARGLPATQLLVRCGCGRFIAPAQDVAHFVEIIEREGSDYVRDVSIPCRS